MGKLLKQAVALTALFILLGFSNGLYAQRVITGFVKDAANGSTLPGVNVTVKEKAGVGTVTDIDGKFSLKLPDGAKTLIFSFIGYTPQEVAIANQVAIEVLLQADAKKLDEVVVTALGIKRQTKALGYAVTELRGEELKTNSINPVSSLQGRVAGVEIAGSDGGMFGSTRIQIRGAATLKGNNQPIYVVDGVILDNATSNSGDADWESNSGDFGNALKNLNPDDFESVTVLKGASATALYGSRGLNGAVVITTKNGKARKGLGINVTQTFGIDHVFATPDLQNVYGPGNYFGNVRYGKKDASGSYYIYDNANQFYLNSAGDPSLRETSVRHFGPRYDMYSNTLIEDFDGSKINYAPKKNNYLDAYNLGYNTNTNIAISGGNDKTTFYSSMSYKKATGTLPRNSFERVAFLAKASHKITDKVKLEASMSFANSLPKNPQPNLGDYFAQGIFGRSYDINKYRHDYKGEHGGMASLDSGDPNGYNPGSDLWFAIYENSSMQKETSVRPTISLEADLLSWLKFKTEANYNYYYVRSETKQLGSGYRNEGGFYSLGNTTKEQTNLNVNLIVNRTINDWTVGGFLRGEVFDNWSQSNSSKTDGGLVVPGQYFIGNSKNQIVTVGAIQDRKRMMSTAFQASASWKNQVFFDVTGRNDWSSALVYSNKTGNYNYFYPSVNGSWLINESVELPKWVSFAKIRASWAQVGNDTEPYRINQGYTLNRWENNAPFYSLSAEDIMIEQNLKPERKNAWEVGLDWRFLSSRINLDATFYKENTKNQIMEIDVPYVSGVKKQLINAGNIQNSGVEIALNTIPFKTKDWEWSVDMTYTKNISKIVSLHENVANYIPLSGSANYGNYRIGSVARVGGEYGVLMSDFAPKRDEKGRVVFAWRDDFRVAYPAQSGKVEEIGKLTPDFLGSISTGLRWKDLKLRVSLDARFGGYVASFGSRYGTAYGLTESSLKWRDPEHGGMTFTSIWDKKVYSDGMIPDGVFAPGQNIDTPNGKVDVGGLTYKEAYQKGYVDPVHASAYQYWSNAWSTGTINDNWFKEVNYIALREITLSYNMPASIFSKIGAKNLGLVFSARNLGYLYNTMPNNENPESVRGTRSTEFRVRNFGPYTANYMFTINVGF